MVESWTIETTKMVNNKTLPVDHDDGDNSHLSMKNLELPTPERFIKKATIILCYMFNYDAFAIYKGTHKQRLRSKFSFYLRPELRMYTTDMDIWRSRLRMLFIFFYSIVLVRFTGVCILQIVKYQTTTYIEIDYNTQKFNGTVDSGSSSSMKIVDTWLSNLLKQYGIYQIFGNVLSDFPGVSLAMHIALLIALTYAILYLPYHYSEDPLDAVNVRIGLNLPHERKRIDIILRENIESLILAMESHQSLVSWKQASHSSNNEHHIAPLMLAFPPRSHRLPLRHETIVEYTYEVQKLRSIRYTDNFYQAVWRQSTIASVIVVPTIMTFAIIVIVVMIRWTLDLRCQLKRIERHLCTGSVGYTLCDIFSINELVCVIFWFGMILSLSIISILITTIAQLILITEIRSDLIDFLESLRTINLVAKNTLHPTMIDEGVIRRAKFLNDALLKMLAKTKVSLGEFRSQARFISQEVSSFLFFFITTLVLVLLVGTLRGPDIGILRKIIIIFSWICLNLMLVLCASMYSQMSKLQEIGWSIVAQLYEMSLLQPASIGISAIPKDWSLNPLIRGWRNLIHLGYFIDVRNSIRPFGVSLTFKRVLQLNFYVTSLAALVLRY